MSFWCNAFSLVAKMFVTSVHTSKAQNISTFKSLTPKKLSEGWLLMIYAP